MEIEEISDHEETEFISDSEGSRISHQKSMLKTGDPYFNNF